MIHSVFELGDTLVREVMVPRTDMVFIERHKTLRQALSLALRSGFSRIPVVGDGADDVVGIVYLKDLIRRTHDYRDGESAELVESVMRPATFVPESKPVDELLREMQAQQTHIAIVVDEYGGTAGLVTIEDILEEIVGEITDEYDVEPPLVEELEDGSLRVSARLHVDELAELFGDRARRRRRRHRGRPAGQAPGPGADPGRTRRRRGSGADGRDRAGRRNRIGTVLVRRVDGDERRCLPPSRPRSSSPRNVPMPEQSDAAAEDAKLVTLARSARARLVPLRAPRCATRWAAPTSQPPWSCRR